MKADTMNGYVESDKAAAAARHAGAMPGSQQYAAPTSCRSCYSAEDGPHQAYIVEEPPENDGLSERSASVDHEPVRYTMAEMEAYIELVKKDREQVQHEVQQLQAGVKSLFEAMQRPAHDVRMLMEEQESTKAMVDNIEKFKQEVSKSLTMLTVKCEMLDKHVPELKDKLEQAIITINTAQESMMAANQNSPAPSERSASIGDFRIGVSAEEVRQLHDKARTVNLQTQKKCQAFESGMMELTAIRARLQEGIAANARHDAKEAQRVSSTVELKDALQAHGRGDVCIGSGEIICSKDLLAQYLREAVDRALGCNGTVVGSLQGGLSNPLLTKSPEPKPKPMQGLRPRTPKSYQVRLSQDDMSPARSLSRSSRGSSLDYSRTPKHGTSRGQGPTSLDGGARNGTARPGTARPRVVSRYETVTKTRARGVDTGRSATMAHVTPTRGSGPTTANTRLPSFSASRTSPRSRTSTSATAPHRHSFAGVASPSRREGPSSTGSGSRQISRASLDRLSKPKHVTRNRGQGGSVPRDLSSSASSIPRRSVERGRTQQPEPIYGSGTVRSSSRASTANLSLDPAASSDMGESSMCDSMVSIGEDECQSTPLAMFPSSSGQATERIGVSTKAQSSVGPSGARLRMSLSNAGGGEMLNGVPQRGVLDTMDRQSPSASLSSANSVPNPLTSSPAGKSRVVDGLPALVQSPGSPEVSSAPSPVGGSIKVKSFTEAAITASQDRSLAQVAAEGSGSKLGGLESTSQLESLKSLHLDLGGVNEQAASDCDQEPGVKSVRSWLQGGSPGRDMDCEGCEPVGERSPSVLSTGLPNGLPVSLDPSGASDLELPMSARSHGSLDPCDEPLSAASLVTGDDPGYMFSRVTDRTALNGSPGKGNAVDRRQSLSRLAPVVEEPGSHPASDVETPNDPFGSWRMKSSLDWLQSQASMKENHIRNKPNTAAKSSPGKTRSFMAQPDAMGQGAEPAHNSHLEQRIAEIRRK